jgi:3-methylcrotonyl-CoA carboxylase alpha subunit
VRAGDAIPVDYDPLIAKLIVWDEVREAAVRRLGAALAATRVAGLAANVDFLRAIVAQEDFTTGSPDTGFIEAHRGDLLAPAEPAGNEAVAMAVIGLLCERAAAARAHAGASADPWSPWHSQTGWRLNGNARETVSLRETAGDKTIDHSIEVTYLRDGWRLNGPGACFSKASGTLAADGRLAAEFDGHRLGGIFVRSGPELMVIPATGAGHRFAVVNPIAEAARGGAPPGRLTAPMPGRIAALLVEPGTRVEANQPVLVLEAMKMEHLLTAPRSGVVKEFKFKLGSRVAEGVELVTFEMEPAPEIG